MYQVSLNDNQNGRSFCILFKKYIFLKGKSGDIDFASFFNSDSEYSYDRDFEDESIVEIF